MKKADKEGSAVVVPVATDLTSKEKRRRDLNLLMIEAKVPMHIISIHNSHQPDKRCLINVYVAHALKYISWNITENFRLRVRFRFRLGTRTAYKCWIFVKKNGGVMNLIEYRIL